MSRRYGNKKQQQHLDVSPPEEGVGHSSKPEGLSVVGVPHIVQHHLSGHTVDGQAQSQPPGDDQGEHPDPDGDLQQRQPFTQPHMSAAA